jgi:hypothetical protein
MIVTLSNSNENNVTFLSLVKLKKTHDLLIDNWFGISSDFTRPHVPSIIMIEWLWNVSLFLILSIFRKKNIGKKEKCYWNISFRLNKK